MCVDQNSLVGLEEKIGQWGSSLTATSATAVRQRTHRVSIRSDVAQQNVSLSPHWSIFAGYNVQSANALAVPRKQQIGRASCRER